MKNSTVQILAYSPTYAIYFEKLNKQWIEASYTLEPVDKYVLENPEEAILKGGGRILFAAYENQIIGTVALKRVSPDIFELTKIAIDKNARGIGAGKQLCQYAIKEAKALHANKVILYSNTRQSVAINLYRQLGFVELPVESGVYERANIKMELPLRNTLTREEINILIESYGQAYDKIMSFLNSVPKELWDWQPPYNKWTIRQNIVHLADSEAHSYIRCRRFIAEPGSKVLRYNQDKWANLLHYNEQNTADALELFRLLRKMSYNLILQIPFEMWENVIEHSENGPMKMWQWLRVYENHTHILQMKRVCQEWQKMHRLENNLK